MDDEQDDADEEQHPGDLGTAPKFSACRPLPLPLRLELKGRTHVISQYSVMAAAALSIVSFSRT